VIGFFYYNPRKYVGRQDKWSRKFIGPFLVVAVPGPVNVKLQRSRRAKPFYTHVDKVKSYLADKLPKPWINEPADENMEPAAEAVINEDGRTPRLETEADAIAGISFAASATARRATSPLPALSCESRVPTLAFGLTKGGGRTFPSVAYRGVGLGNVIAHWLCKPNCKRKWLTRSSS